MGFNRAGWRVSSEMSDRSVGPAESLLDGLSNPVGDALIGFSCSPLESRAKSRRELHEDSPAGFPSATERHASSRSHAINVRTKFEKTYSVRTNSRNFNCVRTKIHQPQPTSTNLRFGGWFRSALVFIGLPASYPTSTNLFNPNFLMRAHARASRTGAGRPFRNRWWRLVVGSVALPDPDARPPPWTAPSSIHGSPFA